MDYYEHQMRRDTVNRESSHALLGTEKELFAWAIGLSARCIDVLMYNERSAEDLYTKRLIQFGNHAINLLWSAWDEMLCGRYDISNTHSRSIANIQEFLLALLIDPTLANQLGGGTKDLLKVRKILRDYSKRTLEPSAVDKYLNQFSHITVRSTSNLTLLMGDGLATLKVRSGGEVSAFSARRVAIPLAQEAAALLPLLNFAASEHWDATQAPPEEHVAAMLEKNRAWSSRLQEELTGLLKSANPVGNLEFALAFEDEYSQ